LIQSSAEIAELAKALVTAQKNLGAAKKDSTNPHFRSKYADFAAVVEASRPALTAAGLAVVQGAAADGPVVTITTRLIHTSGQWIEASLSMRAKDDSPQAIGSATTYGRRYGWSAIIGLASEEDDDGNAATTRQAVERVEPRPVANTPDGYVNWLIDLGAVADQGVEALKATWEKSRATFRSHLLATDREHWDELKARAAKRAVVA
jgi:hypothetical protein